MEGKNAAFSTQIHFSTNSDFAKPYFTYFHRIPHFLLFPLFCSFSLLLHFFPLMENLRLVGKEAKVEEKTCYPTWLLTLSDLISNSSLSLFCDGANSFYSCYWGRKVNFIFYKARAMWNRSVYFALEMHKNKINILTVKPLKCFYE